jgi:hypothetical protein
MSVPVDAVLVDADGPDAVADPVTREDLWAGLVVWTSQHYRAGTIHRTPDCHQLCRSRTVTSHRLGTLPEGRSLCRSHDCWPRERYVTQERTCPYCGESVKKMRYHLPDCAEADR